MAMNAKEIAQEISDETSFNEAQLKKAANLQGFGAKYQANKESGPAKDYYTTKSVQPK